MSHSTESYRSPNLDTVFEMPAVGQSDTYLKVCDKGAEGEYLERLSRGEGLTLLEYKSLVEPCATCGKYFLPKALRDHIPRCSDYGLSYDLGPPS